MPKDTEIDVEALLKRAEESAQAKSRNGSPVMRGYGTLTEACDDVLALIVVVRRAQKAAKELRDAWLWRSSEQELTHGISTCQFADEDMRSLCDSLGIGIKLEAGAWGGDPKND